ncbi:MAG: CoA-transferase [Chloroflexia bacterium]
MALPDSRTIADQMAVCLARLIHDGEVVFQGGVAAADGGDCAGLRALHARHAVTLSVAGGVSPQPPVLPRSSTDPALAVGAAAVFANEDFYDLCARGKIDLAFLGAAQIDAQGRTNGSVIGPHASPKVRLPGAGGAAMIPATARRVVLWRTQHTPRVFVERLDFVSAVGNLDRVVTPLAVLRRVEGHLMIESVHPWTTEDEVRAQRVSPCLLARRAQPRRRALTSWRRWSARMRRGCGIWRLPEATGLD